MNKLEGGIIPPSHSLKDNMGRLEREARDRRVEEQKKRHTVFASLPYQTFMVHAIKKPLLKLVTLFADKFPEPTEENTWHPNSHRLIKGRDEFFKHCVGLAPERLKLLRAGINFVIVIYDYDPPYRMMIDWWAKQLKIENWDYDVPITIVNHNWSWWKEDV